MGRQVRGKNGWLLAVLLVAVLGLPVIEGAAVADGWGRVLLSLLILASVYASATRLTPLILAAVLALTWLTLSWSPLVWTSTAVAAARDASMAALHLVTLSVVLSGTLSAGRVTAETLSGACAAYLLMGVAWASAYRCLELLAPGSLTGLSPDILTEFSQFLYFSLATLTTLGYGDIVPTGAVARLWAVVETVIGVLYLAILMARLVSLYRK